MNGVRIQTGATEPIQATILSGSLAPLTGKTDILLDVQRASDGYWLDWNDMTFKSSGWTTRQIAMTEVSATYAPGEYRHDLNTGSITNPAADDTYTARVTQSPGTDAKNVPQVGEIKVGQYVDDIDAAVSSRATPAQVNVECDAALADYDAPTKVELDAAQAVIIAEVDANEAKINALPSSSDNADAVWDEATAGHGTPGTFGAEVMSHATPTEVKARADAALTDYDPPTKAELDAVESNIRGADGDDLKAISGQVDGVAASVWGYASRTLTSFGTLAADVWGYSTRTLTSISGLAAGVWGYATRTLTAGTRDAEIDAIKAATDQLAFIGGDVVATLDGEAVDVGELAQTAVDAIAKASGRGNVRVTFVLATVEDAVRKVAVGVPDHMILETKREADADWSSPISTKTLYLWYENLGDRQPVMVGEDG